MLKVAIVAPFDVFQCGLRKNKKTLRIFGFVLRAEF
jgi:hypothetical protein